MPKYLTQFTDTTYAGALAFIAGGKSKQTRKVANNTYLAIIDDTTVGLVYHRTTVVAYKADGTFVIDTGGWHTMTTKQRIHAFSPARCGTHKGELALWHASDPKTPLRDRKCSKRKYGGCDGTGLVPDRCYPRWDRDYSVRKCEHGNTEAHTVGTRACDDCDGSGVRRVGGNAIPTVWGGGAARIDATGKFLGLCDPLPVPHYVGSSAAPKTGPFWGPPGIGIAATEKAPVHAPSTSNNILGLLRRIVPDFQTFVPDPHDKTGSPQTIESMVQYLNDSCGWSREQIADWLDTLDLDLRLTA